MKGIAHPFFCYRVMKHVHQSVNPFKTTIPMVLQFSEFRIVR
ncbi:TPA: hypothetical protein ACOIT4_002819 [Enterococcus faecalis]|nr:hypothetical protein [Enterococcus faecalis]MCV3164563.1 hypothetical protein [Enterococcus faecalis]MDK0491923.1 hypothetical protein [Enterococcus faecalis]MDK0503747.1 hypothetical protein [Enterococcus faecalis]MDK0516777.1 hypothetical protein [Enterococcus faecalis]MDT2112087.1 hypothetical protein [Enterococcus faecalis]